MKQIVTDFLVVGSGAGGMVGAITAHELGMDTIVVEKSKYYGGSTAMSGGGIWVPNNPTLKRAGITNPLEEVVAYMQEVTNGEVSEVRHRKYIEEGVKLFEMLEAKSSYMRFIHSEGYSDYHPEKSYGRSEGRSIEALPFDINILGADKNELHPTDIEIPKGLYLTAKEFKELSMLTRTAQGKKMVLKLIWRTIKDVISGKDVRALGHSLVGRLRKVMQENDIPLWLDSPVTSLIREGNKVVGAIVNSKGKTLKVYAKKGVLLACGGFEHNLKLRERYLPEVAQFNFSAGAPSNTGIAHKIGTDLDLDFEFMDDAWWMPSVKLPNGKMFPLVAERAIPRSIIVGKDGKRFTNEASPYVNFVHDQIADSSKTVWQILDAKAFNRYMYCGKLPRVPFSKEWYQNGIVHKAKTITELANKIKVDVVNLEQEVLKYNGYATTGVDSQFNKGASAYDRYYGDPTLKNPNVDSINKAPYYAIKVSLGDLGTKGGIKIDEYARVLNIKGTVVEGLYAVGNASGSIMGRDYPGAGATIGPAMVLAYIAVLNGVKNMD